VRLHTPKVNREKKKNPDTGRINVGDRLEVDHGKLMMSFRLLDLRHAVKVARFTLSGQFLGARSGPHASFLVGTCENRTVRCADLIRFWIAYGKSCNVCEECHVIQDFHGASAVCRESLPL
jgi:hypothetical protein